MPKITKKALHAVVSPMAKAAHRSVNEYCVQGMSKFKPTAGFVQSHTCDLPHKGEVVELDGFTVEWSCCRRPRVVCNVPTPFSLFTFMYCMKKDGKPIAYGSTLPEFLTHAMRAIKKLEA